MEHLRKARPSGIEIDVRAAATPHGFVAVTTRPAYETRAAWSEAWVAEVRLAGSGRPIPS